MQEYENTDKGCTGRNHLTTLPRAILGGRFLSNYILCDKSEAEKEADFQRRTFPIF